MSPQGIIKVTPPLPPHPYHPFLSCEGLSPPPSLPPFALPPAQFDHRGPPDNPDERRPILTIPNSHSAPASGARLGPTTAHCKVMFTYFKWKCSSDFRTPPIFYVFGKRRGIVQMIVLFVFAFFFLFGVWHLKSFLLVVCSPDQPHRLKIIIRLYHCKLPTQLTPVYL